MDGLVFSDPVELMICCAVLAVGQLVYVLFGFGAGLISVGGLALAGVPVQDVVVLMMLVNLPAELWVVGTSRRSIRWKSVWLVCVGIALGVPIGTLVLRFGEPTGLLAALGVFLLLTGGAFLRLPSDRPVEWPRWAAPSAGSLAGVLAGLFGTGGPPLIVYYRLAGIPKTAFRGSLMAIFLLITVVRVPAYFGAGLVTLPRLLSALAVVPAILLGGWLGHRIHLELTEQTFQRSVAVALIAIGALLLLRFVLGAVPSA
jgi:hypothetical protein